MIIDSKDKLVAVKSFARGNPLPLDSSSVFDKYEDALLYAMTSPVAYRGQIISSLDSNGEVQIYVLEDADIGYKLKLVGSGSGSTWTDM